MTVTVFPPYSWCYADPGYAYDNGDPGGSFDKIHTAIANCTTGEFSTLNVNAIRTTGDQSRQTVGSATTMQIAFRSDHTGAVRITATLDCHEGSYVYGELRNWSGVSNAYVRQYSELDMFIPGVIDGNASRHQLVNIALDDVDFDGNWGPYFVAQPGQRVQFSHVPNNTFTAGQSAVVQLTIWDEQYGGINDMRFYGEIKNSWFIRQVEITGI